MASKGGGCCCCNGCYELPVDRFLGGQDLQPQQQYCCSCVPKFVCVQVSNYADQIYSTVELPRDCSEVEDDPILYSGNIPFAGDTVDVQFRFKVADGKCYLCLTSVYLGLTGAIPGDCHEITDAQRQTPNYFCWRFFIDAAPAEWTAVVGGKTIKVTIAAANNKPIEGRTDCLDVYGNVVPDEHPIKNLCCDCGCICECGCIIVYGDNRIATASIACLGDGIVYRSDDGVEITLVRNYEHGWCELELTSVGDIELASVAAWPANVRVGGVANPCPSPVALFSSFLPDPGNEAIFFQFVCTGCGGCDVSVTGCCDGDYPRILTATITASAGCECGSITMSLIYDDMNEIWIGTQPTGFCGHQITLTLSCSGSDWSLLFQAAPCTDATAIGTGSCEPLSLTFAAMATSGLGCCDDPFVSPTLTIVITE